MAENTKLTGSPTTPTNALTGDERERLARYRAVVTIGVKLNISHLEASRLGFARWATRTGYYKR